MLPDYKAVLRCLCFLLQKIQTFRVRDLKILRSTSVKTETMRRKLIMKNLTTQFKATTPSRKNLRCVLFVIALMLACFGLLARMQASPPQTPVNPDGCYPAFTTAEGCNALALLGAGIGNTGIGWYSLFLAADASFNTGVGAGALALTTTGADSNTAVGTAAMLLNTSGFQNVAVGTDALVYNDSGSHNNAVGALALFNNL